MNLALMLVITVSLAQVPAGSSSLLIAVRNGDHGEVQKLLHAGADANAADSDGTSVLMHAVLESDARMMNLLIEAGAGVNSKNALGSTALLYASTNLEKTSLLLKAGADAKIKNTRGVTPMSVAVTTQGSTAVLKLLVGAGAESQASLMASAAQKGDLEAMRFLLSIGVSPGGSDSGPLSAAAGSGCDECVRLLLEKGAPATGIRANGSGVLSQTVKRAMPEMSQLLLDHGASLAVKDREGFTLLMQAVMSLASATDRDRMVKWLLEKGVDPNATNDRGQTAYQLAARNGATSAMELLVKAGARPIPDSDVPKPEGAASVHAAVTKALPLVEAGGEAVYKNRACISCHNNSLPAMVVAMARTKGFSVNEEQAKKELGFAIATEKPFLEAMRGGSAIGGGSDTVGYTLMGMAAAGYRADELTDAHIHYLSVQQNADGSWKTTSYRPPSEYSPFSTTAVSLRAMQLYPIPGRRAEFEQRAARAKQWLLSAKPFSGEERSMQLNGLAAAGASVEGRAPFVAALKTAQSPDGSWSQLPGIAGDAYATGEALYALHASGDVPVNDAVYQKGVQWLLRNQLADGSWFVPARTTPTQPFFNSGFPHGSNQWASDGGTSWALLALLFTLPDSPRPTVP